MSKVNIKKGDKVKVIAGNSRGKEAVVLEVDPRSNKATVEGINVVTKHLKPSSGNPNGSLSKIEMPIHISNLMVIDASTSKPTRVGRRKSESGVTERYSVSSGKSI